MLTFRVRCAIEDCTAEADFDSSRDVYGDADPFQEPTPIVPRTLVGLWRSAPTRTGDLGYLCPIHKGSIADEASARDQWAQERALAVRAFTQQWVNEHPEPEPNWLPWNRP